MNGGAIQDDALPPLIPLRVLFGNPEKSMPQVSPDGRQLAYLAPSDKDVLNVWVRPDAAEDAATQVTNDVHRGIRMFQWSEDGKYILFLQDEGGDENWHLWAQPLDGGAARDLTPFPGVRAENLMTSKHFPGQVLVGLNKRTPTAFDVHRIDLQSGDVTLDTENPGDVVSWLTDADFAVRGAMAMDPSDGAKLLRVRDSTDAAPANGSANGGDWRELLRWPQEEEGRGVAFTAAGDAMYIESSLGSDTCRLLKVRTAPRCEILEEVASDARVDVGSVMIDRDSREALAVSFNYLRKEWRPLDAQVAADLDALREQLSGDVDITSRSADNQVWVVNEVQDDSPPTYHLYRRDARSLQRLFVTQPALQQYTLSKMEGVVITARDGLELPCYLSLPAHKEGAAARGLPLVMVVHGGPWARDVWGCNPTAQWLTNRGYAVIMTNFRGSTGYGKAFLHKGDGEWGIGAMQHDLTDVVGWAVKQGIADPQRVAIYGGSYGGYACLAGLAFTPHLFKCGVDIVGPSHIRTLFQSIPPYWAPMKKLLINRVGDVEADEALNRAISPLYHADKITAPLLIGQGKNDPRVKQAESDQIYDTMKAKGLAVEYVLYTDEGHGFARPPNRLDFTSRADAFLAAHLGGRCEPLLDCPGKAVVLVHEGQGVAAA